MPEYRTVLIIDDDPEVVCGVSLRLEAAGYELLSAVDAEAGIDAAVTNQPDVILLDVRLPTRDGLYVLSALKHRPETQHIPIIMLSASVVDQQAALDAGARFFIKKPYSGDVLLQAVRTALTAQETACCFVNSQPTGAFLYD